MSNRNYCRKVVVIVGLCTAIITGALLLLTNRTNENNAIPSSGKVGGAMRVYSKGIVEDDSLRDDSTVPIIFSNQAWVVAKFKVQYTYQQKVWRLETDLVTIQTQKTIPIPIDASRVFIQGEYSTGYSWETLFALELEEPPRPPDNCYMIKGTVWKMKWDNSCQVLGVHNQNDANQSKDVHKEYTHTTNNNPGKHLRMHIPSVMM